MNCLTIMVCYFKRDKKANREKGIIINEGFGPLIDMNGKIVSSTVWTCNPIPYEGTMVVESES